ncbi:hypothetical protein LCGC14_0622810 [marine sediment metagenome]|uniref:Uncharacterized protein n=1 Tax=marine sediment metagenome TaxID=412755 RepID=A0A0F9R4G4_9ZZZZ
MKNGFIIIGRGGNIQIISFSGNINFRERELTSLRFFKVRENQICAKCKTSIPKGAFCWGKASRRYCLKCRDIIFKNLKQEIRNVIKVCKIKEKKYSKNKKEYLNNNLVASL